MCHIWQKRGVCIQELKLSKTTAELKFVTVFWVLPAYGLMTYKDFQSFLNQKKRRLQQISNMRLFFGLLGRYSFCRASIGFLGIANVIRALLSAIHVVAIARH